MRILKRLHGLAVVGLLTGLSACVGSDEGVTSNGGAEPDSALGVTIAGLQVVGTDPTHVPSFANGNFGQIRLGAATRTEEAEVRALRPTLDALRPVFRLDPAELSFQRAITDNLGERHFVYEQRKNGREVVGSALVLHTRNDVVYAVHGNARADLDAPSDARINPEKAIALAKEDSTRLEQLKVEASPQLVYWPAGDKLDLVYRVNVTGVRKDRTPVDDDVIVDAVRGSVVRRISNIHPFKNREVYDALNNGNADYLPGVLYRTEGGAASPDPRIETQYTVLGKSYDCYKNLFNRDSYDNAGSKLVSSVYFGFNTNNAFWYKTKRQLAFGQGDGSLFRDLGNALDVTAHELTHGVTSATSNLLYFAEPGGLNESMSDIFGSVCEWYRDGQVVSANTWKCAEEVFTPSTSGDALRYMNDPQKDGQSLDYYDASFSPFTDVHLSSGIPNLAFYLLAQGGQHPRGRSNIVVRGIGIAKAAQIFYRANTVTLLGKTLATFADAKTATEQAAAQLGYSTADIASVTAAWQAVGVGTNLLVANQSLSVGQGLTSLDGRFTLVMQTDGNLVLYWNGQGPLWSTATGGSQGKTAAMQTDGNFVLYTTSVPTVGASIWSSNTYGNPGASLNMQNDGNLVLYAADGVTPLWSTGTYGH